MKKYIWPVMTVIICIIIFVFSAQTGTESTGISDKFVNPMENLFSNFFTNIFSRDFLILLIRKGAHISIYFMLGICAYMSIKKLWLSTLFCLVYACSDEIHQLFVEGRSGSIVDVGIDSIGFIIGGILVYVIIRGRYSKKS